MTDKYREAFEAWVLRGSTPQENLLERLPNGDYRWQIVNCGWLAWQACAAHYAPKLTDKHAVEIAAEAIFDDEITGKRSFGSKWKELTYAKSPPGTWDHTLRIYRSCGRAAIGALRAAGVKFRDEA